MLPLARGGALILRYARPAIPNITTIVQVTLSGARSTETFRFSGKKDRNSFNKFNSA